MNKNNFDTRGEIAPKRKKESPAFTVQLNRYQTDSCWEVFETDKYGKLAEKLNSTPLIFWTPQRRNAIFLKIKDTFQNTIKGT